MIQPTMNNFACNINEENTSDNLDKMLDDAFKLSEQDQLQNLTQSLTQHFLSKVLPLCVKVLDLELGSLLDIPGDALQQILWEIVFQGEKEPYGVKGGTLVVNFETDSSNSDNKIMRIGRFPLRPDITSSSELHLTMHPSTLVRHKMANWLEKFQRKPQRIVIDKNFVLTKKKLYR